MAKVHKIKSINYFRFTLEDKKKMPTLSELTDISGLVTRQFFIEGVPGSIPSPLSESRNTCNYGLTKA
jgi:hypothetical protein